VTGVLLGLSAITVFLRCYVRIFMLNLFRPEDWLAIVTLGLSIVYTAFVVMSIQNGAGQHVDSVPKEDIPKVLKMRWAGEITYVATGAFLKLTVGVFLLRICSRRWHKVTICTVLVFCVAFNISYILFAAFQCQPVAYFWERYSSSSNMTGSCFPGELVTGLTYAACGINAVGDWILGLLPIVLVRNLDLVKRQKISVAGILALGAVASTATIVRLFYVWQLNHNEDTLYKFTDLAIWSTVENGLGLTASSIATLRPLFKSFLGGRLSRRFSVTRNVLRKRSQEMDSFDFGPSADPNPGLDAHKQMYGMAPPRPMRPEQAAGARHSSEDGSDGASTLTTPGKYDWQTYKSYELNKEALAKHYYPVSPREARTRWHSDGTRHYRVGRYSHQYQHDFTHNRQSSI